MKFAKKLFKLFLISFSVLILAIVSSIGIKKFKRHAPVELAGTCIIFDINEGASGEKTELMVGRIKHNNVITGEANVAVFLGPVSVSIDLSFYALREKGYIRIKCNEILQSSP
jgi:hypothetical protein